MAGPKNPVDALRWIQEALEAGRFVHSKHFRWERLEQRGLIMDDVFSAAKRATKIEPYSKRKPVNGGTCWRIHGPSLAEVGIAVGVEAFYERQRHRVILCTVFVVEEGGSHEV